MNEANSIADKLFEVAGVFQSTPHSMNEANA